MEIERLEHNVKDVKQSEITVSLSYDEVRDLANALYYVTEQKTISVEEANTYSSIYAKCSIMRDLMKYGNIQKDTADKIR